MLLRQDHGFEAQPPERLRLLFKRWQKSSIEEITTSSDIVDLTRADYIDQCLHIAPFLGRGVDVQRGVTGFLNSKLLFLDNPSDASFHKPYEAVEIKALPGANP
jgi:hypothetical protein